MKKPIIAIDVDDVLADSTEALRLKVNRTYGVSLTREHYRVPGDYSKYYERVWEANGIADRVSKDDLNLEMQTDQSHILPHAEAVAVLKHLKQRYELIVVTARNSTWEEASRKWVADNFPGIFTQVLFAGQRDDPEQRTKGDACAEAEAAWLIDDNLRHAQTAIDNGISVVLFGDYGWHIDVPEHMPRCRDWAELDKFLTTV